MMESVAIKVYVKGCIILYTNFKAFGYERVLMALSVTSCCKALRPLKM
jgi:hypothetical protein